MPIRYEDVIGFQKTGTRARYGEKEVSLYALSLGYGTDPLNEKDLDFVLESRGPRVVPTMASVMVKSISRELGLDMTKVLHGEQRLALFRVLPPAAELIIDAKVTSILDKGPGKGAIVSFESVARVAGGDAPLFNLGHTLFARGDGGCGGPSGPSPARHVIPERAPDISHTIATRPDQALLYRLSGDLNPLHADPAMARKAGFERPILHGLCSYGIACRAVLETVCGRDENRITEFDVRFTAPVVPGEAITTDIWVDGDVVSFRSRVAERDTVVLDSGRCRLGNRSGAGVS